MTKYLLPAFLLMGMTPRTVNAGSAKAAPMYVQGFEYPYTVHGIRSFCAQHAFLCADPKVAELNSQMDNTERFIWVGLGVGVASVTASLIALRSCHGAFDNCSTTDQVVVGSALLLGILGMGDVAYNAVNMRHEMKEWLDAVGGSSHADNPSIF